MSQPTIILAMSSYNDFTEEIKTHLEYHNYRVTFIDSTSDQLKKNIDNNFQYPSLKKHITHSIRKILFLDGSYKAYLKQQLYNQQLEQNIRTILANNYYDYTLVIRPDLFPVSVLQLLKSHTRDKIVGYQWNGIKRFPKTITTIPSFDKFYIFDPLDLNDPELKDYKLYGISNFYFDMYQPKPIAHMGTIAYFVGLHFDTRIDKINTCANSLAENGIVLDFNIKLRPSEIHKKSQYQSSNIQYISENISYKENLQHINKADILIDIVNPVHQGLSFRVFEALYYEKKLITNNTQVKNYDFYHPNNILIWNTKEDLKNIAVFLTKPYVTINTKIVEKYSFANWIKNILDTPPFQPISLFQG
ncbi:MAG: hypothetical protein J6568_05925 [Snodgrassella sp.]|nr:hypothetical protein [Snodgrassella sp.]